VTPQLLRAATGCTAENAERFAEPLSAAMAFYGIDTPQRKADFLAQVGHESNSLRWTVELWGPTSQQLRYERDFDSPWPADARQAKMPEFQRNRLAFTLGNSERGDGALFKGHGCIQTTGRFNHARVRDRLRERFPHLDVPDFEAEPERLAEAQWACLSAADYWDDRGLNALADADDFIAQTKRINGGLNGLADRQARRARARKAITAATPPTHQPAPESALASPEPGTEWPFAPPTKENTMPALALIAVAAPLLTGLARSMIDAFTPLAREKLTKELDRHSDNPEVVAPIVNGVIDAAKALTGKADPIEAVVAAKVEPEIAQQVEADTLATLERMAPMLDKLAQWDRESREMDERSFDAAAKRAAGDPNDQDVFLTRSIVGIVIGLLLAMAGLLGVMVWLKASEGTIGTVLGLFSMAVGVAFGEFKTRYQHRYGTSRSSAAKDVMLSELTKRRGA
jgi:putative chitinase